MDIQNIISKAQKLNIEWVLRPEPGLQPGQDYDTKRRISNARFSYRPAAIAYCRDEAAVAGLFRIFGDDPPRFRIRSGGHQHEGMCSADDVLLIDLSKMKEIKYGRDDEGHFVSIGPGWSLGALYDTLGARGFVFPGGGCGSVRPGGLIQGGGWGPYVRMYGMSCDNLLEARVVLAPNGNTKRDNLVTASEVKYTDLFWAIRGGGGGNFGVVTEYKVRVHELPKFKISFRFNWSPKDRREVARVWLEKQNELSRSLTTFCRISVVPGPSDEAIFMGGVFLGSMSELLEIIRPLREAMPNPTRETYSVTSRRNSKGEAKEMEGVESFIAEIMNSLQFLDTSSFASQVASESRGTETLGSNAQADNTSTAKAPSSTCDQPHPHKVSSVFPAEGCDYGRLAEELVSYIEGSKFSEQVNQYVSLHCMGGAVSDKSPTETAFPYRTPEFMLQPQAWWARQDDHETDTEYSARMASYIQWIENFRASLSHTGGAFINFIDRDVPLKEYYGGNFERLKDVKKKYDPNNLFSFEMSIPPAD